MMIAWCVLLAPVFLYIRLRAKSAVAAAVAHGTLNAVAGIAVMPLAGGDDLTTGLTGLAGFAALGIVLISLRRADRNSGRNIMSSRLGEDA
jgi:multisubunit Na+/H+ antiporter MnhE subunit